MRSVGDAFARISSQVLTRLSADTGASAAVLCFHRVGDYAGCPTWNVRSSDFECLLGGLIKDGYRPATLDELLSADSDNVPIKRFAVTFDDGYQSVLTRALPILQRLAVPATVFLSTAYVGEACFPFDDWNTDSLASTAAVQPLSQEECKSLLETGLISFGSHTHTHADFRDRPAALAADLDQSRTWLSQQLGCEPVHFAFPYGTSHLGFCSGSLRAVVQRSGMLSAFTTDPHLLAPRGDRFNLGRFLVSSSDNLSTVRGRLNRWYAPTKDILRSAAGVLGYESPRPRAARPQMEAPPPQMDP